VKPSTHNRTSAGSSPALPKPMTSPIAEWMLNSYSKHAVLTTEDIDLYFKNKEKEKQKK
jgi:capsular polysaccharide biosynthesis protein